jgi:phytoene dehydrogenase-like protein
MILDKTGIILKNTLRQNIIRKINHTLNTSIEKHIVMEEVFTPKDIEN